MGFAILWIILFHSGVYFPEFLLPLAFFKDIGYSGVDIFFLMSGIGLVFSITNNKLIAAFYKKRILRIIPTYWICLFLFSFKEIWVGELKIKSFFLSFFGLDFLLLGELTNWFVPSILICYVFFPVYFSLSAKYGFRRVSLIFSMLAIAFSVLIVDTFISYLLIFTIRIPIFLFGCYVGFLLVNKKVNAPLSNLFINFAVLFFSLAALAAILVKTDSSLRWNTGLWWYPTIFMAFPVSMLLGHILGKVELRCSLASKFLRPFGVYSLELYLMHDLIFSLASKLPLADMSWNFLRIPEYLIYLTCSVALSMILQRLISKAIWFISHAKKNHPTQTARG